MSLQDISAPPTRQAAAIEGRSAPGKVTGKLKVALDAMVWQGACRPDAAATAGLTDHSVRTALTKPHVKAYYLTQLEVLRTSERARNIHALVDVRDQVRNPMARVNAVKALEQLDDQQVSTGTHRAAPGLVVQIINSVGLPHADRATSPTTQVIDVAAQPPDRSDDGAS